MTLGVQYSNFITQRWSVNMKVKPTVDIQTTGLLDVCNESDMKLHCYYNVSLQQ